MCLNVSIYMIIVGLAFDDRYRWWRICCVSIGSEGKLLRRVPFSCKIDLQRWVVARFLFEPVLTVFGDYLLSFGA